jgi:hypothetical protein
MKPQPDEYLVPDRWPWVGDSKIGQVQRIARSYRELCRSLVYGTLPDPAAALEAEDAEWARFGHHWINPQGDSPEADHWLSVRDCAFYVSQFTPCTERDVHNWVQRDLIEYRHVPIGEKAYRVEVLWKSVLELDAQRTQRRSA